MALRALVAPVPQLPSPPVPALRADEPLRPAQPGQVVQAVGVSAKPGLKVAQRPRVVLSGLGTGDPAILLRLNGYPKRLIFVAPFSPGAIWHGFATSVEIWIWDRDLGFCRSEKRRNERLRG